MMIEKAQALGLSVGQVAVAIQQNGCPRTRDVRAAKNALYLAKHGKSGGLNIDAAKKVSLQHDEFQEASRYLRDNAALMNQRPRYKRQRRAA